MIILAFSGFHENLALLDIFLDTIAKKDITPDLLITAGDIGTGILSDVLEGLLTLGMPILYVGGNWESGLESQRIAATIPGVYCISHEVYTQDDYTFIGQDAWTDTIVDEIVDNKRYDELKAKWEDIQSDNQILVTHHPPLGILDRGSKDSRFRWKDKYGNLHGGSMGIRLYVEEFHPAIHIFSHLHSDGGKWIYAGNTLFTNVSYMSRKNRDGVFGTNGSFIMIDTEEMTCIPHHLSVFTPRTCACGSVHYLNYRKCINCYDDGNGYLSLSNVNNFNLL